MALARYLAYLADVESSPAQKPLISNVWNANRPSRSRLTTASSQIESTTLAVLVNTVSARSLAQVIASIACPMHVSGNDEYCPTATLPAAHVEDSALKMVEAQSPNPCRSAEFVESF